MRLFPCSQASQSKVLIHTMSRCDGDTKFPKVYKHARHMLKTLKNPNNGKKLIVDERLNQALKRVDTKFGGFHLKLIACVRNETTELLLTSANFHNWHFHYDHSDMVVYFRLPTDDFRESYLEPLGLVAHQFGSLPLMPRDTSVSTNASESGSIHSPSNTSAQAFPTLESAGGSNKQQQQQQQQNGVAGDVSSTSSGTTTPAATPRSNRSSNRPTPNTTPKVTRIIAPDNQSTDTLTNETTAVVATTNAQAPVQNHIDVVDGSDQHLAPTHVTKTTTIEKGPDSHITKTTTTYETTTTYRTNSLPRNTPSPRPGVEPPPPPPPPPPHEDEAVDIAIHQYNTPPRGGVAVPRDQASQPHSNTSTLSRQSDSSRSYHEEPPQILHYSQQSTLPSRDRGEGAPGGRAQSYHGPTDHTQREYRHDVSRSYNEAQARNVAPIFTEVRTAQTKKTTPVYYQPTSPPAGGHYSPSSPVGGHHSPIPPYPPPQHHSQGYERKTEQSSLLQRASPVAPFHTELQQVKTRSAGPRDQFSHSFEKRMSSLEESGEAHLYNEAEPEPEPHGTSPAVHPIYSEVKRSSKKKPSTSIEDDTPPPMPPVFVETRNKKSYVKEGAPQARSVSPPEVPEAYKEAKARAQVEETAVAPETAVAAEHSPPPLPTSEPPADSPEPRAPYDPQLRHEFSPTQRAAQSYTPTYDEYEKHKQALKDAERNQARIEAPYTLPLSVEKEEKILPKEERHKTVVSSPKGPNFSPTFEESPHPIGQQEGGARSPTVDYTEVPIYPEVKPTALNVSSSPTRRVPSDQNEASSPTNAVSPPAVPASSPPAASSSSSQHEETYQMKPVRSLHPSVTTVTTHKEIQRRSGSREATPSSSGKRDSHDRDSVSPHTKMTYAYTEMTPAEAQALYSNVTAPEPAKGGADVQEVKTTRHRIEVTRVTHIDTTNVRPYDRPDISSIRFADAEPKPTESHI